MRRSLAVLLFTSWITLGSPLWGQDTGSLGPKDGVGLPPTDLERVAVGTSAPDFTLESKDGKFLSLSDYRGKKNVVLVFYRGHW